MARPLYQITTAPRGVNLRGAGLTLTFTTLRAACKAERDLRLAQYQCTAPVRMYAHTSAREAVFRAESFFH